MERNREARSSSTMIAAANGSSRRRNRATVFRDLQEEGQVELQETVRLRERAGKRDRDRDFSNKAKRRRGGSVRDEVEEEEDEGDTSAEETVAEGDSDEVEGGGGVSRILSSTTASSASNQNQRRNSLTPRVGKQQWKVADDAMIGVPVPRKARSASVKRSHDCTVSGYSGVGGSGAGDDIADDQTHRNPSDSPARSCAEVVSPSTSIMPIKKKMKTTGPKIRTPKMLPNSSPSAKEGDIEIEIAEVLFGLMKQSQCSSSSKQEVDGKPLSNVETDNSSVLGDDTKSSVTPNSAPTTFRKSVLHQNNGDFSDLLHSVEVEKNSNKSVHDSSSPLAQNESSKVKGELEQPVETKAPSDFNMNSGSREFQPDETKRGSISTKDVPICGDDINWDKKTEESTSCAKMNIGLGDSLPTKSNSEAEIQKEEKFKFDLMAPPTSPGRDGLVDMISDAKPLKAEMKETSNKEKMAMTSGRKLELSELDFEKTRLDSLIMPEQSQNQPSKGVVSTVEKNESSSTSVRLPITLGGWPTDQAPTFGYISRTTAHMGMIEKSSTKSKHPNFILSHPRSKRCLTHYDIARNIYLHQQFTKTNYFQPAAAASVSLAEANLKKMSSSDDMILKNSLNGNKLDMNLSSAQQRELASADFPGNVVNGKSPDATSFNDMAKNKQLVLQQTQGASRNNLLPGPGFIFPISQHQSSTAATANQSGSTKSSNSSTSLFSNIEAGPLDSFPALPPASTSSISFGYLNPVSIESSYSVKLQNNGYTFPFSTSAGTTTTYRANPAQALPLFNGSLYQSQMFHPSQIQPPQTLSQAQSQHVVQSVHPPSGSLPHKQSQPHHQQWSVHVPGGNNLLPQKQSTEKHAPLSNQSRKHESETRGEDTVSVSESRTPQVQKNVYGQNFILPVQALNFSLMPNNNGGSHSEKKQSHPQNTKSTVAVVPSQALTMSFASFSGNGTPSNLNFTPISQNAAVFQSLPDMQRAGFQVASTPQATTKQKNHQISEGRNGGGTLSNPSDRNTGNSGKTSSATSGQNLVFSSSTKTLNFMSSPTVPGSWPPPPSNSMKSAGLGTNRPAGSPRLQMMQMLKHPVSATPRAQVQISNSINVPSVSTKFPYNAPGFSHSIVQCDNPIQKNSGRMATSFHLASSTGTAVHKNLPQQKGSSAPQGQTQISFGGDFKPTFVQGQQIPTNNHPPSNLVTGSPSSNGKLKNDSTGSSKTSSSAKQDESSSTGGGQKSSPVCGRNVPSILNACPSQLSELKY